MTKGALAVLVVASVACGAGGGDPVALKANIGKAACNQTNGVYRGQIVDVATSSAPGQSPELVYIVDLQGRRMNAPVSNTVVAERCGDGQPAAVLMPKAEAGSVSAEIDPELSRVAAEFSGRLVSYGGFLQEMRMRQRTISAKWTSQRCDMAEGEVIDLLLSINRGHAGGVRGSIEGVRTCEGKVRSYSTTGSRFEQYRSGAINDTDILKGLK